jgi:hypothetical protein
MHLNQLIIIKFFDHLHYLILLLDRIINFINHVIIKTINYIFLKIIYSSLFKPLYV